MAAWKRLKGTSDYTVSDSGCVFRGDVENVGTLMQTGYIAVSVHDHPRTVHRLVAEHFLPNPDQKPTVNHKNLDKADNRIENLEWATHQENHDHARHHLGNWNARGSKASGAVLVESQVLEILGCLERGMTHRNTAKQFGVTHTVVTNINVGRTWSHLTGRVLTKKK